MAPHLALGSAHFGARYGIDADRAQSREEIAGILDAAAAAGISLIDTAAEYGASEKIIGELDGGPQRFNVITKTVKIPEGSSPSDAATLVAEGLDHSLKRLRRSSVYAVLVHRSADLLGPNGPAIHGVLRLAKEAGQVGKIGVSAYAPEEIEAAVERFAIDIAQCPINVFDQRATTSLASFRRSNVEIHARSVFLQGLLLRPPGALPAALSFAKKPLERFGKRSIEIGLTRAQAAVAFVANYPDVYAIIAGVRSLQELGELVKAVDAPIPPHVFRDLATNDPRLISPSTWFADSE